MEAPSIIAALLLNGLGSNYRRNKMLQQTNPNTQSQQPVYQPPRRRVRQRVAAKPAQPQTRQRNKSRVAITATFTKALIVLLLAYLLIPMEWLPQWH